MTGAEPRRDATAHSTVTSIEVHDTRASAGAVDAEPQAFPLSIGGPEADVRIAEATGPLAYLGLSDGDVFLQPADGQSVIVNGARATSSKWLADGDVLRFDTAATAEGAATWMAIEIDGDRLRLTVRGDQAETRAEPPRLIAPSIPAVAAPAAKPIEPIRFEPRQAGSGSRSRRGFGLFGLAVAALLLVLVAAAGFLLTSRSVEIAVEPTPDAFSVEGGLVLELGGRHVMRPGNYVVQAQRAGFTPLVADFEVTGDSQQSFRFALEKLPGQLTLVASVDGAEVLVDGESHGLTPLEVLELAPGERQVLVRADRHREFAATLAIEGGGARQTLQAELEPLWAEVRFASQPAGARVRVGGEELGTTPLTAEVLEGQHDVQLVLAGYKPYRSRLEVVAGEPQELPTTRLQPSDGNLVLTSQPTGAAVSIGGVYSGETPLDLYLEPGRDHEVSISKLGHTSEKRQVRVVSGQSQSLDVELQVQEGEVQISAWPGDAELRIDGEPRGNANQKLRLTAVAHEIEVRKDGFVSHRQTVTPLPGVPQWVEVTLKPEGQAEREKQAEKTPAVVSRHDHELRLIEPGKLRMGASRREPGRRANEVLREIELTRPFYLSAREVSNQQFRKFAAEHSSGMIGGQTLEIDNHPVVRVTWHEAAAYCNWLSAQEGLDPAYVDQGGRLKAAVPMTNGYRLPTEAEWAWAARYGQATPRKYPWGSSMPVPAGAGNYADTSASGFLPAVVSGYRDKYPTTAPVASFDADARGFYDFGGNVAEWVHDLYAIRFGTSQQVERDPLGPTEGEYHVIRGSSWMHSTITELRFTYRDYGNEGRPDVGFRIARYAE